MAELNELSLCAANAGNAYLEACIQEKLFIIAGLKFGELEGHTLIVHKALYGLTTSGVRWTERLAASLRAHGFTSSYADPAIWMREQDDHWEYVCVWVDDMLIMSRNTQGIFNILEKEYTLKGDGFPKYYLGADMKMLDEPDKVLLWDLQPM